MHHPSTTHGMHLPNPNASSSHHNRSHHESIDIQAIATSIGTNSDHRGRFGLPASIPSTSEREKLYELIGGSLLKLLLFFIVLGCLVSLSVAALVIAYQNEGNTCLRNAGLTISYIGWLKVYGYTGVAFIALGTVAFISMLATETEGLLAMLTYCLAIPYGLFCFAWFVVGAVLFFQEAAPDCRPGPIYHFGLALFIIQCILYCGSGGGARRGAGTGR